MQASTHQQPPSTTSKPASTVEIRGQLDRVEESIRGAELTGEAYRAARRTQRALYQDYRRALRRERRFRQATMRRARRTPKPSARRPRTLTR